MECLAMLLSLCLMISRVRGAQPNILLIMLDEMPFLDQWKESAPADLVDVLDAAYPTPHIDAFRNEAVIFPKSYCGGPKCAPSRYSILTGRQPSRCGYIEEYEAMEYGGPSVDGPLVSISSIKMVDVDGMNSIPYILQNDETAPYYTGMIGKWHLQRKPGCARLDWEADAKLYDECTDLVKDMGFDFVGAFFHGNIDDDNDEFSHNPEWMVDQSEVFIAEALGTDKPFFMYFASTLAHSPSVERTIVDFDVSATPKGKQRVAVPTLMMERTQLWDWVLEQDLGDNHEVIQFYATYTWIDQMLGALFDVLSRHGVYDDTFIMLTNDHGMEAKGLLYQRGSRVFNFVRYPAGFGTDGPMVLPPDFVVSNVDMAATVFELAGITSLPRTYIIDGQSYLTDVSNAIHHPGEFEQTSCVYKFIDMYNSHSIVSAQFQYIFRATDEIDPQDNGADDSAEVLYPNVYDMEQLYDLDSDPSQQINIFNDEQLRLQYATDIATMQSMMRRYVQDICQMGDDDAPCLMPELLVSTATPIGCCYATDLSNMNAANCVDIGDSEEDCEKKASRWSCAYGQGEQCTVVPTAEPSEPGCCYGDNSKCDTDDEATCEKNAKRGGCEWRAGSDADCAWIEPTTSPGCCFGSSDKCDTDEAGCLKSAAVRAGCEWRSGDDPTLCDASETTESSSPGCCFGSNAKCDTDEAGCLKSAAVRAGCEWRSGDDPTLCDENAVQSVQTSEPSDPGCCNGENSKCDTDDEATCEKNAKRGGCEWRAGEDADCEYALESQVLSVLDATKDKLLQSNGAVKDSVAMVVAVAVLVVVVAIMTCGVRCYLSDGAKEVEVAVKSSVVSYGSHDTNLA